MANTIENRIVFTEQGAAQAGASIETLKKQADMLAFSLDDISKAKPANPLEDFNKASKADPFSPPTDGAKRFKKQIDEASGALDHLNFNNVAARRELMVLAHEMSQGNYKQFAGSMMVLAERTDMTRLLFSATGIAALGMAGGVAAVGYAILLGIEHQKELDRALQNTSNYSGLTAGRFDALAVSAAKANTATIGLAREALMEVARSGRFGEASASGMTTAVLAAAKATGASTEDIVKDFSKMADGVANWAADHNKAWHFITADQYAYIVKLEETGQHQQAMLVTANALTNHFRGQAQPALAEVASTWTLIKIRASEAWDAMQGIGRPKTLEQTATDLQEEAQASARKQWVMGRGVTFFTQGSGAQSEQIQNDLRETGKRLQRQSENATAEAVNAEIDTRAVEAKRALMAMRDTLDEAGRASREIDKYRQNIQALKASDALHGTSLAPTPKQQAKEEAALRSKYEVKPTTFSGVADRMNDETMAILQEADQAADLLNASPEVKKYQDALRALDKQLADINTQDKNAPLHDKATAAQRKAIEDAYQARKAAIEIRFEKERDVAAPQRASAEELKQFEALTAAREKAAAAWMDYQEAERQGQRDREFEISLIGKTTEEMARLTMAYQVQKEAKRQQGLVMTDYAGGGIDAETMKRRLAEIDENAQKQMVQRNRLLADQFKPGWQKMVDGWGDTMNMMKTAHDNAMQGVLRTGEDVFIQWAKTGKLNARSMVDSILDELLRLEYRKNIAGPLASAASSILGSLFGTPVNQNDGSYTTLENKRLGVNHTGGIAGVADASYRSVNMGVFANAPRFHTGGITGEEVPIITKRGEGVFTPAQMKALAPVGSVTPQVNVHLNVVNQTDAKVDVKQRQGADGSMVFDLLVARVHGEIANDVGDGVGPLNAALTGRYGLRPSVS